MRIHSVRLDGKYLSPSCLSRPDVAGIKEWREESEGSQWGEDCQDLHQDRQDEMLDCSGDTTLLKINIELISP